MCSGENIVVAIASVSLRSSRFCSEATTSVPLTRIMG